MKGRRGGGHPKPTAVLKAEGSFRQDQHGDRLELPPGSPECPDRIQGVAREAWAELCQRLEPVGVISSNDGALLERYCKTWAEWLHLEADCKKRGKFCKGRFGRTERAEYKARNAAHDRLMKMEAQLAIGCVNRAGTKVEGGGGKVNKSRGRFFAA